jgi:hypothetical protein
MQPFTPPRALWRACIAIIALAAALPPLAVAQTGLDTPDAADTLRVRLRHAPASPVIFRDDEGSSLAHFIDVAQYFPDVAVRFECGEIRLLCADGDTVQVAWDHPLTTRMGTPRLPVYLYNSAAYANELVTLPFRWSAGDTLSLFRVLDLRFPLRDANGKLMPDGLDTAAIVVPDTVSFTIEVLDDATHEVLGVLERLALYPVSGAFEYTSHIVRRMMEGELPIAPLRSWPSAAAWDGRRVRLRVAPVWQPQLRGEYGARAMYAFLFWGAERSGPILEEQRRFGSLTAGLLDSLRTAHKARGGSDGRTAEACRVHPSVLTPERNVLTVQAPEGVSVAGDLRLYDLRGVPVFSRACRTVPGGEARIAVPVHALAAGAYLLVVDVHGSPVVQPLTIIR